MKRVKESILATCMGLSTLLMSCSRQTMDSAIKGDITTKAKSEIAFAGVNYTVAKGVVQLSGVCPSQKERDKVESTVSKISGVKSVVNAIITGPVVLDENFSLKQSVDSVLKDYILATAQVSNKQVTLTGQVNEKELKKITEGIQKLPVSGIDNRLTVQ
jgi:osmotically-inducible protein OsmY